MKLKEFQTIESLLLVPAILVHKDDTWAITGTKTHVHFFLGEVLTQEKFFEFFQETEITLTCNVNTYYTIYGKLPKKFQINGKYLFLEYTNGIYRILLSGQIYHIPIDVIVKFFHSEIIEVC